MKKLILSSIILGLLTFGTQINNQAQAFNFFKKDTNSIQKITQVKAKHILVDTKEEALALQTRISNGESFDKLAAKYSKCPSGRDGGDLGFFSKGAMVPSFEKAAFSLPIGQVSEPIQTQFGWHLIVVTAQK